MFDILNLSSEIFYYKFICRTSQQEAHTSQYVRMYVHMYQINMYVHICCAVQSEDNEDIVYVFHFFSTQSELKFA